MLFPTGSGTLRESNSAVLEGKQRQTLRAAPRGRRARAVTGQREAARVPRGCGAPSWRPCEAALAAIPDPEAVLPHRGPLRKDERCTATRAPMIFGQDLKESLAESWDGQKPPVKEPSAASLCCEQRVGLCSAPVAFRPSCAAKPLSPAVPDD